MYSDSVRLLERAALAFEAVGWAARSSCASDTSKQSAHILRPSVQIPPIHELSEPYKQKLSFPEHFFQPKPLTAVIGASASRENIGRSLLDKLRAQRIPHYAIAERQIPGVETFHLSAVGKPSAGNESRGGIMSSSRPDLTNQTCRRAPAPDILLIATPADTVQAIIDRFPDTAKIVYSAGFEDAGKQALAGSAFVGPNSVGVIGVNDFTFFPKLFDRRKRFGIISHSGAVLGMLAAYGGAGFSVGNATVLTQAECVQILARHFRRIAIYCENDDSQLLKIIKDAVTAEPELHFAVLLGGTTKAGADRAAAHTGRCLSRQFASELGGLKNVQIAQSFSQLLVASTLKRAEFVPVTQSGFCATRAADLLQCRPLEGEITQYLQQQFASEKIPARPHHAVVDVTPMMSASAIVRICRHILQNTDRNVLLSLLGDLNQKNGVLAQIQGLQQHADRLIFSVEQDPQTAKSLQDLGFVAFTAVEEACAAASIFSGNYASEVKDPAATP